MIIRRESAKQVNMYTQTYIHRISPNSNTRETNNDNELTIVGQHNHLADTVLSPFHVLWHLTLRITLRSRDC